MNKEELEFKAIYELIESHRQTAYRKINEELVTLYYEVGEYLSKKTKEEGWGSKTISNLSKSLIEKYPTIKGFDRSNLFRMMQFYDSYKENEIVAPLARQISWTNNTLILSCGSSIEEKEFYIRLCIKNNYSKRELRRQIESHYYQRYLLSHNDALENLEPVVGEEDEPNTRILDQYSLEFLDLPNNYK